MEKEPGSKWRVEARNQAVAMSPERKRRVNSFVQYIPSLAVATVLLIAGGWKSDVDNGILDNQEKAMHHEQYIADLQSSFRARGERINALELRIDALTESADVNTLILRDLYRAQIGEEWER